MNKYVIAAIAALIVWTAPAWAGRYALVIGNGAYPTAPLKNPKNDAVAMAGVLKTLDFSVTLLTDAKKPDLETAMAAFVGKLKSPDDVALLFYAGHGVQFEGQNYLLPVDANIVDPQDLVFKAIPMDLVLGQIARNKEDGSVSGSLTIAFFDACRDNPFRARVRSAARGLAPVQKAGDTYIIYATAPNDVAADGDKDNSPFTLALTEVLKSHPDELIEQIFKRVAKKVLDRTGGRQRPWSTGTMTGDFYFRQPTGQSRPPVVIADPAPAIDPNVFSYYPPGDLKPGSGEGSRDYKVWAPDIVFPVATDHAYVNSQIYGNGGALGPSGGLCDAKNYSYPWRDNFCEKRSWSNAACPSGKGNQGVSIRGPDCKNNVHPVVAVEAGIIETIGDYSVTLAASSGRKWSYRHMEPSSLTIKQGDNVKAGKVLGRLSNAFGGSPTSIHLALELSVPTNSPAGEAQYRKVSPYMSLVRAYERKVGRGVEIPAQCTPAAPQGTPPR